MADNFFFFGAMMVVFYGLCCSCKLVWVFLTNKTDQPPILDMAITLAWAVLQVAAFAYLVTGGSCHV